MPKNATTRDLTHGNPMRLILNFAIPFLFGLLFQQLYSFADTVIVGRYLGTDALAAVGATSSINFLIIGFCTGVCNGFVIPVAQQFGAGDITALRRFVANSVWLSAGLAGVTAVLVTAFCRPILQMMKTPEDIIDNSYAYIVVIFIGIPVTYLYNLLAGFIRSLGDSKTPVIFLTIAALLNVGLDLLFILVMQMGVGGAAWATVISQAISGLACLFYIRLRFPILHLSREHWKPDKSYIKILCGMGLPMGLQYSITAIGSVILQSAVNTLGSLAVAAVATANKVGMFVCCPFDAMGATMATYAGQNVGARKLKRLGQGMRSCIWLGAGYSVIGFLVVLFAGRAAASLFLSENDPVLFDMIERYLRLNGAFYFTLALVNIIRFMIQGLGFGKLAVVAGVCEMIARAVAGFLLVPTFGFDAVGFASPLAWTAADIFLIAAYVHVMKVLRQTVGEAPDEPEAKLAAELVNEI